MKIAQLSVRNSLLVNLASVFIILLGGYSMWNMQREAFPSVTYDILTISTVWPGAPAEDVEKFVTIPLEEEIKSVGGIDEMTSKSEEGLSEIGIYIDPGATDKDKVVKDVERAVDRVRDLPDEIEEDPVVFELATREFPVLEISISGTVDEFTRREYADALEDILLDVEGVSQIRKFGWRDPEFWVEADPQKLREYHVSMQEVMDALRTRNITVPGGEVTADYQEYNIRTTGEFRTAEEIADVIIRANDAGNWLRIRDVARVTSAFEDQTTIARIDGARATAMVVVKSEQADAIDVVDRVNAALDEFRENLPPEMEITTSNDFSYYVKRRLGVLQNNGIIGFILVISILFLFLDPIPAFMTAIGIPLALAFSFLMMAIVGVNINLVSMLGILLVLGMLVDDGIIVAENVFRHFEEGKDPSEAAIVGTNEVATPVTITILTTFAAFAPLLFMSDIIGKFIREIPIVVIITLTASLFEAFIILPSHLSDVMSFFRHRIKPGNEKKWFVKLKATYTSSLKFSLKNRYLVLGLMIAVFFSAIWVMKTQLRFLLFAGEGIEQFFIRAEAPKGTSLERTGELMRPIEEIVAEMPESELDNYRTYVGAIEEERGFDPNARRGTHLAQITVFLTPLQQRDRTPQQITDSLRPKLKKLEGFEKVTIYVPREGPPIGPAIEVGVKGKDFEVMEEIAQPVIEYLNNREGVSDVTTSYEFGKKQLRIVVDEEKARKYQLSVGRIAETVRNAFKGGVATTIKPEEAEEEIAVRVRFPEEYRDDLKNFEEILIPNARGNLVKLMAVAQVEENEGIYRINHLDGKRVLYITAQVDNKNATSLQVNQELQAEFPDLASEYLGYSVKYSGEYEDQQESTGNLLTAYLFALFLIFILLVAMFNSLIQPFIVMAAIPFGIIGVIYAFWIHDIILINVFGSSLGRPLNFFAMMGLVGLTGIVVNDSVVLVDFVNRLRKSGKERRPSLIEAGQMRLRPVIMTSVTTIGGLVAVAYGIGGGDPFLKPMALAVVWGLTFSTLLTLIGIPCLYAIIDDFTEKVLHKHMVKVNGDPDRNAS